MQLELVLTCLELEKIFVHYQALHCNSHSLHSLSHSLEDHAYVPLVFEIDPKITTFEVMYDQERAAAETKL